MSHRNSPTSPTPRIPISRMHWLTSSHPFATCHILCQPLSLAPPTPQPLLV